MYRRINDIRKRGSFTIEAAFITPMILGVTVMFIYTAMYCHDRCVIEYVSRMACELAVYGDEEPEAAVMEFISGNLPQKLMCCRNVDIRSYSEDDSIVAEVEAETTLFAGTFVNKAKARKHFFPRY